MKRFDYASLFRSAAHGGTAAGRFDIMFGPYSVCKTLCECGALADLDEEVVLRRKRLGKRIECMSCRNKRISKELDPDDEEE